ncbi:TPA: hypothetical protein DIV48_02085 [Candidatus Kaiserbacteria bacterium]|nr:hypothetical protein [Candidatus Kaiserbacteria bacterium]
MNMLRFLPYVGALAVLALVALAISFSSGASARYSPSATTPHASSTLSVLPSFVFPALTFPSLEPRTSAATVSASRASPSAPLVLAPAENPAAAASSSPALPAHTPLISSGAALRKALVNIICRVPANVGLLSITGSGVMVHPKGIILTNAHIGQYFLFADRGISCVVRTGGPAVSAYKASLLYLSPAWIQANSSVLTEANPKGTGQYDFALLAVTGSATAKALPASYPYVPLAAQPPNTGTPVAIASYGAQFLGPEQIESALFPTVVFGSVKDIYTFGDDTIDVLALGGSAAAQEGSSGGGVVEADGELVGIITTSTLQDDTGARSLHAITASYIRTEYANETGKTLSALLAKSLASAVADFSLTLPALEAILVAHLP